jgi:hypothetical protein
VHTERNGSIANVSNGRLDPFEAPPGNVPYLRILAVASRSLNGRKLPFKVALVTAVLEGTMAAVVQILGATNAFNLIQPLADQVAQPGAPRARLASRLSGRFFEGVTWPDSIAGPAFLI